MDADGEAHAFNKLAHGFVLEATELLDLYSEELPLKVRYALLEYSVVKYFRPFGWSNTRHAFEQHKGSRQKRLRLSLDMVPEQHLELHRTLQDYRDKAYAHFDLDAANVRASYMEGFAPSFVLALSPVDKMPLHIHMRRMRSLYMAVAAELELRIDKTEANYLLKLSAEA